MKYALPEEIFDATYNEDLIDYVVHFALAEISKTVYIYNIRECTETSSVHHYSLKFKA
jgi:hypothetical protein